MPSGLNTEPGAAAPGGLPADDPPVRSGLPPLWDPRARWLVLGSFPSQASLAGRCYYGHPRNHFWFLVASVLGEAAPEGWPARRDWLLDRGLAVWDVVASCRRQGSLDQDIRQAVPNDIPDLVARLPRLETILLNGGTAARLFARFFPDFAGRFPRLRLVVLPSSSPVPTARYRQREAKLASWQAGFQSASSLGAR